MNTKPVLTIIDPKTVINKNSKIKNVTLPISIAQRSPRRRLYQEDQYELFISARNQLTFLGLLTDEGVGVGSGGCQKGPLPKICHTFPTMIELGTVIPYLKRIQKIYESRDTPPSCFNKPGCNFDDVNKNWLHQAFSK